MRKERRKPTKAEWSQITSRRPVVRRIAPPEKPHRAGPNVPGGREAGQSASSDNTSRGPVPAERGMGLSEWGYR